VRSCEAPGGERIRDVAPAPVLRSHKIVRFGKEGKMAYYSLDDEHIDTLMREALRHVREGVA